MKTNDIDLVKIVDEVWKENELHSGTYKVAALTAMQKLQDLYENKRTEQQQGAEKCTLPVVIARLEALDRFDVGCWYDGTPSSDKEDDGQWVCFDDIYEIITALKTNGL